MMTSSLLTSLDSEVLEVLCLLLSHPYDLEQLRVSKPLPGGQLHWPSALQTKSHRTQPLLCSVDAAIATTARSSGSISKNEMIYLPHLVMYRKFASPQSRTIPRSVGRNMVSLCRVLQL